MRPLYIPRIPSYLRVKRRSDQSIVRIYLLDNLLDTVDGALVLALGVLQPRPHHLVGVGGQGGHQLRDGGECEVKRRGDGGVDGLQVTLLAIFVKKYAITYLLLVVIIAVF